MKTSLEELKELKEERIRQYGICYECALNELRWCNKRVQECTRFVHYTELIYFLLEKQQKN